MCKKRKSVEEIAISAIRSLVLKKKKQMFFIEAGKKYLIQYNYNISIKYRVSINYETKKIFERKGQ